jgi:hypothetical protein
MAFIRTDALAVRRLHNSESRCFRQIQGFTLLYLLQDYSPIPKLVHSDPVSRQQMQSVSYGKRKQNPAIGINASNQARSPDILVLDPGL